MVAPPRARRRSSATSRRRTPDRLDLAARGGRAPLRASAPRRVDAPRRRHLHPAGRELLRVPGQAGDAADVRLLIGQHERDADTAPPGAAGAADAMDVSRVLGRGIEVDDVRDVDEVEPARGDVGRDERRRLAGLESPQRPLALALAEVAVERDRVDLMDGELLDEPIGAALRSARTRARARDRREGAPRASRPCRRASRTGSDARPRPGPRARSELPRTGQGRSCRRRRAHRPSRRAWPRRTSSAAPSAHGGRCGRPAA